MGLPRSGDERGLAVGADTFLSEHREEAALVSWTSLHPDVTNLIAERLLAEDVTEYMRFRFVCSHWRASTASPRDATLADRRFHPRGWVALCDGNGVRPVEDAAITFFHTVTSRVCRLDLPGLRGQRIVGITDGLLILFDIRAAVIRVLHALHRRRRRAPPPRHIRSLRAQQAEVVHHGLCRLDERHRVLYGVTRVARQLVRVYPSDPHSNPVVAEVPKEIGHPERCLYFLVESMGAMFVAVLHKPSGSLTRTLFRVDLPRRELTRVTSLGDRALFISRDRCLSVSSRDLPCISGNSIYLVMPDQDPVKVYSLDNGSFESTLTESQEQDIRKGVLPTSVRPFTLAHHLATYCRHREWTRGLMFHEYCSLSPAWRELWKKIAAQDSEVYIPRLIATESQLKKLELPNLFSSARTHFQALSVVLTA